MTELGVNVGDVVAERYHLEKLLGQGAMASVWAAEDRVANRQIALKILKPEWTDDEKTIKRFLQEARAAGKLQSPYVVRTFDHGYEKGRGYIAMELLVGESLEERLQRQGALSSAETMTVMEHVCRAVELAHQRGMVHRDIKPSNIFLVPKGEQLVAKVLDFGLVKIVRPGGKTFEELRTTTGMALGTPFYMSPEQLTSDAPVDQRADLWALAVVAYECLCGQVPFSAESMGELVLAICTRPHPIPSENGTVPPEFDLWFARAAALQPGRRFKSLKRLIAELAKALGPAVKAPAESKNESSPQLHEVVVGQGGSEIGQSTPTKSTTLRWFIGLLLLVIGAAAGWLLLRE